MFKKIDSEVFDGATILILVGMFLICAAFISLSVLKVMDSLALKSMLKDPVLVSLVKQNDGFNTGFNHCSAQLNVSVNCKAIELRMNELGFKYRPIERYLSSLNDKIIENNKATQKVTQEANVLIEQTIMQNKNI